MLTALGDVARDEDLWEQANHDIDTFLAERGVKMPVDVTVKPTPGPGSENRARSGSRSPSG